MQSDYFDCDSCGQQAKLFHGLCPECLPKYEADPPPDSNKASSPSSAGVVVAPSRVGVCRIDPALNEADPVNKQGEPGELLKKWD